MSDSGTGTGTYHCISPSIICAIIPQLFFNNYDNLLPAMCLP